MSRRSAVAALLLVALPACSSVRDDAATATTRRAPTTTSTPSTTSTTSTTAPPPPPAAVRVLESPAGVALPVERVAPGGGWVVRTPCGHDATTAAGTPLVAADVVLDPGHGGDERGAVAPNGLHEKDVNLAVAQAAAAALRRAGSTVVLTRTGDVRMTLGTRALVATTLRPRAFVSIHHNSDPDGPSPRPGTETYFQVASSESKRLAGLVYEEVERALEPYRVAWVADRDAGAKYRLGSSGADYYGILRRTAGVTAALAELAFVSNAPEAALLARPDVQVAEGDAVARGIVRFLTTNDPGSGFVTPYPRTTPAGPGGGTGGCVDPAL
jgi:N-acetylmuramoyl-L-alanine amidase